jgi:ABC-type uncharacterized transport system ATPase subunit
LFLSHPPPSLPLPHPPSSLLIPRPSLSLSLSLSLSHPSLALPHRLTGKNGAGKSTTISILTGLTAPTSGRVSIFGNDVTSGMDTIRTLIGICPQEDVLWDELTVMDHLRVFGKLKGMEGGEGEEE